MIILIGLTEKPPVLLMEWIILPPRQRAIGQSVTQDEEHHTKQEQDLEPAVRPRLLLTIRAVDELSKKDTKGKVKIGENWFVFILYFFTF